MHRVRREFALSIARPDFGRPAGKEYDLSTNGEQAKTGRSGRPKVVNEPPWWKPMIWAGCDFFAWNRLLARNRYHIHWSCLHVAIYVFFVSFFHTLFRGVQWVVLRPKGGPHLHSRSADFHHRALADRHDALARASGPRRAARVSDHV